MKQNLSCRLRIVQTRKRPSNLTTLIRQNDLVDDTISASSQEKRTQHYQKPVKQELNLLYNASLPVIHMIVQPEPAW